MENTKKQAKGYDSPLLLSLLEKTTSEAYERTCNRMMMAARIEDGMKAKGWNQTQFAEQIECIKKCGAITFLFEIIILK